MGHEHVYGICENKCRVEVKSKAEIETELTELNNEITALKSPETIELTQGTEYVLSCYDHEVTSKGRKLLINHTGQNVAIKIKWQVMESYRLGTFNCFCQHNGTFENKSASISGGPIASEAIINWFTMNDGDKAIVELFNSDWNSGI